MTNLIRSKLYDIGDIQNLIKANNLSHAITDFTEFRLKLMLIRDVCEGKLSLDQAKKIQIG